MFDTHQREFIAARVRIMRIIVLAMAGGVILFLALILCVPALARPLMPEKDARLLTYIAAAYGGVAFTAASLVPPLLVSAGIRRIAQFKPSAPKVADPASLAEFLQSDAGRLSALYTTKILISAAFCEGAALFLCVAYMLGRNPAAVVVALVLLAALLWQLPTVDRAQRWIDQHLRKIEEERTLRR